MARKLCFLCLILEIKRIHKGKDVAKKIILKVELEAKNLFSEAEI